MDETTKRPEPQSGDAPVDAGESGGGGNSRAQAGLLGWRNRTEGQRIPYTG